MAKKKRKRRSLGKRHKKILRRKPMPWRRRRRRIVRLVSKGKLTAARLKAVMKGGGDLAPMTGVATFGSASGSVTVTVAVAPANDRDTYKLYSSSNSTTPSSASQNKIAESPNQPPNNLIEGSQSSYVPGQPLTVQLSFVRTTPTQVITVILTGTVPGNQVVANTTSLPFTLS